MSFADNWLWFFLLIALALGLQLVLTAWQAMAFTDAVHLLRRSGRVAVGTAGHRWWGRRVFVALAVDPQDGVVKALRLRGITQFARAREARCYTGLGLGQIAGPEPIPGCGAVERDAARHAATTLSTAGGKPTADGAPQGRETSRASSAVQD